MLPTMISQTSEDRGMGNVPGTPTSVAGSASGSGVSRHAKSAAASSASERPVSSQSSAGDNGIESVDKILFGGAASSKSSSVAAAKVDYKDFRTIFQGSEHMANGVTSSKGSNSNGSQKDGSSLDSSLWG